MKSERHSKKTQSTKMSKDILCARRKAGAAILISDRIEFKQSNKGDNEVTS